MNNTITNKNNSMGRQQTGSQNLRMGTGMKVNL